MSADDVPNQVMRNGENMRIGNDFICPIMVVAALLTQGCAKDLSRTEAAALLSTSPQPDSITLRTELLKYNGRYFRGGAPYPAVANGSEVEFLLGKDSSSSTTPLMIESETAEQPFRPYTRVVLTPTPTGQRYVIREMEPGHYEVKMCEIVFGEVTGIRMNGDQSATVEYTTKRVNWTPFGDWFRHADPNRYVDVIPQKAELQRYDDGWRVRR
jgi:hypothetical protein